MVVLFAMPLGGLGFWWLTKTFLKIIVDITTNTDVQQAVAHIGAEYVLVLDKTDRPDNRRYQFTYRNGENWTGIENIDDTTPGFSTILSEGDMRLYRIDRSYLTE